MEGSYKKIQVVTLTEQTHSLLDELIVKKTDMVYEG